MGSSSQTLTKKKEAVFEEMIVARNRQILHGNNKMDIVPLKGVERNRR